MKKSISTAMDQAQQMSARNPEAVVRVMDKPKRQAVVVCFEWVYKERVLDGHVTVAVFKAGKEV